MILWFTGLSGAGKSTLGNAVKMELFRRGLASYLLHGDNIRRIGEVAKLFLDVGVITLSAFVSSFRSDRARALAAHGDISHFTGISSHYEPPEKLLRKSLWQRLLSVEEHLKNPLKSIQIQD